MALAESKLDSGAYKSTVRLHKEDSPAGLPAEQMEEVDYESLPSASLSTHLCAGAAAGTMEHCFMYPVDCVKVSKLFFVYIQK